MAQQGGGSGSALCLGLSLQLKVLQAVLSRSLDYKYKEARWSLVIILPKAS